MEKKNKAIIYLTVLAIVLLGIGLEYNINWLNIIGIIILGILIVIIYTPDY